MVEVLSLSTDRKRNFDSVTIVYINTCDLWAGCWNKRGRHSCRRWQLQRGRRLLRGQVRPLKKQGRVLVLWRSKLKMKCLESRELFKCLQNDGDRNEGDEDMWLGGCWFSFMCERKNMTQVYLVSKCRSCRKVLASSCLLDVPSRRGPNLPGPLVRRILLWPCVPWGST